MRRRIVLLGATGLTGRLIAAELAGQDQVLLVGRRYGPLTDVGLTNDLPVTTSDLDSLGGILHAGDVLVSTVGPFDVVGDHVVRMAISRAVTYLDVSGEPAFLDRVYRLHGPEAATLGVTLLPAVGYEYLPGHLVAHEALTDAGPRAVAVEVAYLADGGLRAGSAAGRRSLARALSRGTYTFRRGRLRREAVGARRTSFQVAGERYATISLGGAEVWSLPAHHPQLRSVDVLTGWFGPLGPAVSLSSRFGLPFRLLQGDRVVDEGLRLLGDGDPQHLRAGRSRIVARARAADGTVLAQRDAVGGNAIVLAARLAAAAAEQLAERDLRTLPVGASDPLTVFGRQGLTDLCSWAGVVLTQGSLS